MNELKNELKNMIIETLELDDIEPEDIVNEEPLFGDGLGLDSIDALELVVALDYNYGIKIEDSELGKQIFASINALADYVNKNRKK